MYKVFLTTYRQDIKSGLWFLKHYYVDTRDPEGTILKLALRTAFACALSIISFQYLGNALLSTWAGFAAFAFVQNDTLEPAFPRFYFLIAVILVFTGVTFLGMVMSYYSLIGFICSVPIIIFSLAYLACLGARYFNAGGWAMFLYIMAGSNAASIPQASQISVVFLSCGIISLLVCFLAFPGRRAPKILLSYRRTLAKLGFILHILQENKDASVSRRLNVQLDQLCLLQEQELSKHLSRVKSTEKQQTVFAELGRLIYQLCLMTKSTIVSWGYISSFHEDDPKHLQVLPQTSIIEKIIQAIIVQIKKEKRPDFVTAKKQLALYRENITAMRQSELNKLEPDVAIVLEYTRYFYHYLKLVELLEEISQGISKLQGAI